MLDNPRSAVGKLTLLSDLRARASTLLSLAPIGINHWYPDSWSGVRPAPVCVLIVLEV